MRADGLEALRRNLLPGESVIQRYQKVVSERRFRAVLTDRRVILLGRNAVEEIHLNSISSMGWRARRRWRLVAAGLLLIIWAFLGFFPFYSAYSYRSDIQFFVVLAIVGAIALVVAGVILKKHAVHIYASGRDFEFVGKSGSINEFLRDVRLQQSRFPDYIRLGTIPPGVANVQSTQVYMPPPPPPPPQSMGRLVYEKETISEVVKIPCKYCGSLVPITATMCPSCAAPTQPAAPAQDERIQRLTEAYHSGRITREQYQANMRRLHGMT